jgi:hypothetical protein
VEEVDDLDVAELGEAPQGRRAERCVQLARRLDSVPVVVDGSRREEATRPMAVTENVSAARVCQTLAGRRA